MFSKAHKAGAVNAVKAGESYASVCKRFGVGDTALRRWVLLRNNIPEPVLSKDIPSVVVSSTKRKITITIEMD